MTDESENLENPAVTRILDLSVLDPARLRELEQFRRPITVLFADIAGSTAYFERFGDIAGLAMVYKFNHLAREAVEEFGGRVIKSIGDGIMATFEDTGGCLQTAIEIQLRLSHLNALNEDEHRITVRIGLHHGMGIVRSDNDVFGDVVNVASRIQSLAQGGQILVSNAVQERIANQLFRLRTLGFHQLKGRAEELDIFEAQWIPEAPHGTVNADPRVHAFQLCHLHADSIAVADSVAVGNGMTIGKSNADLTYPEADMDSPHARLLIADGQPIIEDLGSSAGVFVQLMGVHILVDGDTIGMGRRLFQFSLKGGAPVLLPQEGGPPYPLNEQGMQFGRTAGDHIFPDDGYMSRTHARVYRRGENYLVEDLGSRNGTFVKVRDKARIPLHARIWIGSEYFSVVEGAE